MLFAQWSGSAVRTATQWQSCPFLDTNTPAQISELLSTYMVLALYISRTRASSRQPPSIFYWPPGEPGSQTTTTTHRGMSTSFYPRRLACVIGTTPHDVHVLGSRTRTTPPRRRFELRSLDTALLEQIGLWSSVHDVTILL